MRVVSQAGCAAAARGRRAAGPPAANEGERGEIIRCMSMVPVTAVFTSGGRGRKWIYSTEQSGKVNAIIIQDDGYDYEADDAVAVVYMVMQSGKFNKNCLYVMKRADAVKFCSHPKTTGCARNSKWFYAFTTHRRDWRESLDDFRPDDGRFAPLLAEMGITPIWTKGQPVPKQQCVKPSAHRGAPPTQLSLLALAG